jgi:hypothetical protein
MLTIPTTLINFSKKFPKFLKKKFQGIPMVSPQFLMLNLITFDIWLACEL